MDKLAIVDIETTGGRPQYDRVIEVGVVLVDNGTVTHTYNSLINPQRTISPIITTITGITQAELVDAPTFNDIYRHLYEMLEDRIFVAHNVRFDYSFLSYEFNRLGVSLHLPHACSVRLSRLLYPQYTHHNLDKVIERFNLTIEDRHRALGDAMAVSQFIQKATQEKSLEIINEAFTKIISRPSLPSYISEESIKQLPSGPGVYMFYGERGELLYVGKSVHIRDRVRSHFYADLSVVKEQRIKEQVRFIEAETTAGELSALLKEAELVKSLNPIFNQKLKRRRQFTVFTLSPDDHNYLRIEKKRSGLTDVDELEHIYGTFRSSKQAENTLIKLAREHSLCSRLIGLEKGNGACFGYHIEQCQGACMHKEDPESYNQRLRLALAKLQTMPWPYLHPVVVSEYNEHTQQQAHHIFYRWCYVGSTTELESIEEYAHHHTTKLEFDLDTYHILAQHLKRKDIHVREIRL